MALSMSAGVAPGTQLDRMQRGDHPRAGRRAGLPPCAASPHEAPAPAPLQRRAALALAAAATVATPRRAAAAPPPPALSQFFTSSEGFTFSFPAGWVVAYDRSGGRGDGAVVAVGDFTRFLVVSVFRTVDVPAEAAAHGLDEATGRRLCLDPLAADDSTMRFREIKSEAGGDGAGGRRYDFEYEIDVCRGEIQEGSGGVLRCLGGMGQGIPAQRRHHVARAVLSGGRLLTINAAAPVDKWPEVEGVMREIVESYRAV